MAATFPYHPANGTTTHTGLIILRLGPVTKTATFALVEAPTSAPSTTAGSSPYINRTSQKGFAVIGGVTVIWGVIVILLFYYKCVKMMKPKRKIKPTAKAQAGSDSSDGDDDMDDFDEPKSKSNKRQLKAKAKATAKGKTAKGKGSEDELALTDDGDSDWEDMVEHLTTDPKSPFSSIDLIAEFSKPDFKALLTAEDKKEIADLLPDHINLTADGQLPDDFVRYNPDFRSAVRQYQLDLEGGRYDPAWLAEADAAMEERAQGNFDQWKEEQFEEFWGQKQKVDSKALAGQSSTVKLNRLIEAGLCKVGDSWSYSRVFGQGKKKVLVEKVFKLTDIEGETLSFAIPPGAAKYARRLKEDPTGGAKLKTEAPIAELSLSEAPASPASDSALSSIPSDVEDYIPISVTSLASLEEKIVALDGKFSGNINGNAWKSIRVKRQEQDLGSLFDIRERFFVYGEAS